MDRRERIPNLELSDAIRGVLLGWQAKLWTALPGIILSFNGQAMTVEVQPAIQARVQAADGSYSWVNLPKLLDVPIVFQGGGGYMLTFPVAPGDEALVIFSSRCFDDWWLVGEVQQQAELRMHDLSDGFAIVGPRSQPHVLDPQVAMGSVQLRANDGSTFIEIDFAKNVNIVAPTVNITGDLLVTGNTQFTGTVQANNKPIDETHQHINVQPGSGDTGIVK
jgi:hypothetical protein